MRIVFVGASALTVMAARLMADRGYQIVVIDKDESRLLALGDTLDCGRISGDGTRPIVLKEADPANTDFLFCLTGSDQANIIASLVGRSLGFQRVVTRIDDPDFEHICIELGLHDTIIPARTIGRFLTDMVGGRDPLELSALIKDDAAVFSFVARSEDEGAIESLELPDDTRVICRYRSGQFDVVGDKAKIKSGDEMLLITRRERLPELEKRWVARDDGGAAPGESPSETATEAAEGAS
jgi:trk system potassium uptake protein TrkA